MCVRAALTRTDIIDMTTAQGATSVLGSEGATSVLSDPTQSHATAVSLSVLCVSGADA